MRNLILKEGILMILFLLICFQFGCVTHKHKYRAYQDMKVFVLDEYNRSDWHYLFFETNIKDNIIYLGTDDLQSTLIRLSKFNDSYFKDMMMGKIIFSCGDFGKCFTPSPVIMGEYKKKGIDEFIKMYAIIDEYTSWGSESSIAIYTINPFLSHNEQLSIAYCFYQNNIYTVQDCYSFEFKSRKDLTPILAEPINMDDLIPMEE